MPHPILITIPISHYCEKARWALDRAGIAYKERAHLQVIHWIPVARAGGKKTAPVLVWGDRVFADSAEIVEEASARARPERALFPDDPAAAAEVRALQREFDEVLGPEGRRWMYFNIRGRRDIAIAYGTTGVPAWERRGLPLVYPLAARIIDRYLDITPANAEQSEAKVHAVFESVAERLGDGRAYLCGERFSAADLTFASLAASLVMPPEYGVPLPQPDELPPAMATKVHEFRTHPAGAYALKMFREERR
ncbi:MAG TPA: glutathione S-transferase family protein [Solirubrobacterales bacterium]|nr:glutathione S-transferase family protein [Solirubrobacterales bacterium]